MQINLLRTFKLLNLVFDVIFEKRKNGIVKAITLTRNDIYTNIQGLSKTN